MAAFISVHAGHSQRSRRGFVVRLTNGGGLLWDPVREEEELGAARVVRGGNDEGDTGFGG